MEAISSTFDEPVPARTEWLSAPDIPLDRDGPAQRPPVAWPGDFTERPVFAHLLAVAARHPGRPALCDGHLSLAYGDLVEAVRRLAWGIAGRTREGAAIGILLPLGTLQPLAMLACLAAGRPFVVLDPRNPPAHTAQTLAAGRIGTVIQQGFGIGDRPALPPGTRRLDVALAFASDDCHPCPGLPLCAAGPDDPAAILFTSGSTGQPKGIVNGQRALLQRVRQQAESIRAGADDVFLPLSAPGTIAGTRECLTALLSGACLTLFDLGAGGLADLRVFIRTRGVSVLYAVPALWRILCEAAAPRDLASLRVVRLGGDRILWSDHDLLRAMAPGCLLQIGYSSTETTGSQWFVPAGAERRGPCVPVGTMLPGTAYRILGGDDRPVPAGEVGELVVHGHHVALGTWCRDGFVPAADADSSGRTHRTGDLVRLDVDGLMEHVGRKDRQMKVNGRRVEPAELEALLRAMPEVRDAVVASAWTRTDPVFVAFVATSRSGPDVIAKARAAIRAALPTSLHPARIHVLPEIPRLPSFKPDLQKLLGLDRDTILATGGARPRPPSGDVALDAVREAWRIVLGPRAAAMQAAWDASGGDSLGFMRMLGIAGEKVGQVLSPARFALDMTAERMAELICAAPPDGAQEGRPTVFFCPGVIGVCPGLGAFMREAGDEIRFVDIEYPAWRATPDPSLCIDQIVESALEQIAARRPDGEIFLAGYSLGGLVALELAARLIAQGRQVSFLGILDASLRPGGGSRGARLRHAWHRYRDGLDSPTRMLTRPVIRRLVARGGYRWVGAWIARLPRVIGPEIEIELTDILRTRAYADWVGKADKPRLDCPVWLFRSQEPRPGIPSDLGWSGVADTVRVIEVGGSHLAMLRPPHRAATAWLFKRELAAALPHAPEPI